MSASIRLIASVLALVLLAQSAAAGSLWAKATRRSRNLYADDTARDVGDMLTIVIKERSSFENEMNREGGKKSSRTASTTGTVDLMDLALGKVRGTEAFRLPKIDVSSSYDNQFAGESKTDGERTVDDHITVAVEDVLPNGNLVVLGTRYREVMGDRQIVQVSGIVRTSDISFANRIDSTRVADFRLVLKIEGQDNHYTRPGWFNWMVNVVNPF